jgi:hypothetical protein
MLTDADAYLIQPIKIADQLVTINRAVVLSAAERAEHARQYFGRQR